ncbi:MAG: Eco57I restriction-modification methylase domain-containing protein [Methanothrix sp.]
MAALPDDNLKMVKWKAEQFRQIKDSELSRRLAELANVWLSTYFGNKVQDDDYYELQNHLSPEKFPDWAGLRDPEWFGRAQELAQAKRFFHWELEFPEAFHGEERGFHAVVGNPPWIMVKVIGELDRGYYRKAFITAEGKFDIYALFIDQGLSLLRSESHLGFVVSNKFLRAGYGKQLRDLILNKSSIEKLIDYSDLPLFGSATNYSLVLILKNKLPEADHLFDALVFKDNLRGLIESEIKTIATRFESSEYARASQVNQSLIQKGDAWDLTPDSSSDIINMVRDLSIPLYTFCSTICQGVWTGKKDVFVDGITQELVEDGKIEPELVVPVIDGRDIGRYFYNTGSQKYIFYPYSIDNDKLKLIDIEEFPMAKAYLEKHRYDLEQRRNWGQTILEAGKKYYEIWNPSPYLQKKKILTQDISDENKFALDDEGGYLAMNTCYALVLRDDLSESPKFLLSLLNSKLLNFAFSFISPKIQGGFFRYKKQYLEPLPIRRISFTTPVDERARQGSELKALYSEGKHPEILAAVDACLPKDDAGNFLAEGERSDVVHDLLAFLAEKMLEMNKEKQKEIRGFLGWLEGFVGAKVEDLTPKTKLQSYYEHDFESFQGVLKKNRKKLAVDPARREPGEALKAEFDKSLDKLLPLLERIRRTDGLIDAIVYKLYALTEEEIGIVEGRETSK